MSDCYIYYRIAAEHEPAARRALAAILAELAALAGVAGRAKLQTLAGKPGAHPLVKDCCDELLQYIKTPGGVIDNNQYGILGYADDAYFIQSLLPNMQQGGVIDTSGWNTDWSKIALGSEVVFNIIGNGIKEQLENNITVYFQQLLTKYDPQVADQQSGMQEEEKLQQMKDDVWKAKLMSLQTSMIHNPVW